MYFAKETLAGHVGLDKLMQTSLRGIRQKAKENEKHRFQNLYQLLNEDTLMEAWKELNKKASAGVDEITAKEFKLNLRANIKEIVSNLKEKRYRTKLVRRVNIPKGKNESRPLGIPALSDKLVQRAVAKILEVIYEEDFLDCSYGYRPKIGAHKGIKDLTKELQFNKYSYIVEADIKGFFNNINHEWLIRMIEERVDDSALVGLIRKWLKAGILDANHLVIHPATGTPQGGIISPILANIYLHYALDLWFEKGVKRRCEGEAYLCRYADDFVCAFRYKKDADRFYKALGKRLRKFELELAEEKTNIISFSRFRKVENTHFDFLGFEFRWGVSLKGKDIIKRCTSKKKLRASLQNFKEWCKENRNNRLRKITEMLNKKLRGYFNYYGLIGNYESLWKFYTIAIETLYKWLNRRSQRKSFNWSEFTRLMKWYGVLKPKIVESSDHQLEFQY
ncbi:group II intron reverse transcriptase/maturase [Clostridium formicaceticum]|uniref:Group II intron reverse transcriptase/maturase n=1 Tax=Clostridium formicaceticum TaxID=1497 RepID=A0AAC9WGW4_9CLOT|nr:group II intron reverse transcriptase/maturase [Clostridium formicaceticum]AOY77724.1 group II intron reverse transcriptase/maturase [Clostridium formicaceticum]ARE88318.1 Group II intron-encoded protein LtrA [Clostridium formicaceticum]